MSTRWSAEAVLALAPDDSSRKAATGLVRPANRAARWSGTGATPDLVWGLCAGSGKDAYQIVVELSGPAYTCSCPSRKFPCKHALGLLLTWANGEVPDREAPSDYAAAWAGERRARAERAASRTAPRASSADGAGVDDTTPEDAEAARKRDEAAAARRAQRTERVSNGLSEMEEWLRDQVRVGLPTSVGAAAGTVPSRTLPSRAVPSRTLPSRTVPSRTWAGGQAAAAGSHADMIAARMMDAQAPGVAGMLRDLSLVPLSGEGWPGRLLAGYAQLHLLARAHGRLDSLPPGLAATVRSRVGYTTGKQEVLAEPAVPDRWLVTGVRDIPDATVPTRRIWLRGRQTEQSALLLAFAVNGAWSDPDVAMLPLGTELDADVHYYPGDPPLRALAGARRAAPVPGQAVPTPSAGIGGLLADWAAAMAADPWLTNWPALLTGTPVPPPLQTGGWHLVDPDGAALPLRYSETLWTLLAISGGNAVTVAGELTPDGLTALTAWHGNQAVAL